jgi:hypothetical protein
MTRDLELFGTNQAPVARRSYAVGPWSLTLENGALRHITLNGAEAIRGIFFLVRDRDWGTLVPYLRNEKVTQTDTLFRLSYDAGFETCDARLDVHVSVEVRDNRLCMSATGRALGAFETNRAGFTVLHPISGVAGHPVRVTHSSGTSQDSSFPALIAPWQPFMDIAALTHCVGEAVVTCQFSGDTFEMEDQRQWGDASFKTYNRPLAKPWPYTIEQGGGIEQSVTLSWDAHRPTLTLPLESQTQSAIFPEMALVITPEDAWRLSDHPGDLTYVNPQRILCHLDATLEAISTQFDAFAAAQTACPNQAFDLELICRCDADPAPELVALAAAMLTSGFNPASILICPSVDRQSTPPGSDWPACPPLEKVHAAAALAFPDAIRGGGVVSFFPELNRKPPPVDMLDFVSHGLCPIVHAADDLSVMETLEAVPHITRTARHIVGKRDYRIGPASIAMRQNPYGGRTIPNPDSGRICMADSDPRHRAKFGAAYVMGLTTALAPAGISIWTPAALYGPRGVVADQGQWPIAAALKCLAGLAGQTVHSGRVAGGIAQLRVGDMELAANLTADPIGPLGAYDWSAGPRT